MDADLTKLKVTELRAELQARGLDTKAYFAQLINHLKEALNEEHQQSGSTVQDIPRLRRSSRSRTKPEEREEPEESAAQKDTEMYEKIIDEMDDDKSMGDEEESEAEDDSEEKEVQMPTKKQKLDPQAAKKKQNEQKTEKKNKKDKQKEQPQSKKEKPQQPQAVAAKKLQGRRLSLDLKVRNGEKLQVYYKGRLESNNNNLELSENALLADNEQQNDDDDEEDEEDEEDPFKCKVCNKEYINRRYLRNHRCRGWKINKSIKRSERIKCDICGLDLSRGSLKRHNDAKHNKKEFPCKFCDKTCTALRYLKRHLKHKHTDYALVCDICGAEYKTKRGIYRHVQKHIDGTVRTTKCYCCELHFQYGKKLWDHMKEVHADQYEEFPCKFCDKTFPTLRYLKRHLKHHHTDYVLVCDICGAEYKTKSGIYRHVQKHIDGTVRTIKCYCCELHFQYGKKLWDHLKEVHADRYEECQECNRLVCKDGTHRCKKASEIVSVEATKATTKEKSKITIVEEDADKSNEKVDTFQDTFQKEMAEWIRNFNMKVAKLNSEKSYKKLDDEDSWACKYCDKVFDHPWDAQFHGDDEHGDLLYDLYLK